MEGAHRRDQADVRPARRSGASAARSSATVRTVFMPRTVARAPGCARRARRRAASSSGAASAIASRWRGHRGLVAARDGPGERRSGPSAAQFSTVRRTSGSEQRARVVGLEPGAGGDPLGRRLERDQEVRGDRGGGVVGGAGLVVDLERRPCRAPRARSAAKRERLGRRAGDGTAGAGEASGPSPGANVWSGCRPKASAPAGSRRSAAWRRWCGRRRRGAGDGRGGGRDLGVGHAQQRRVAAGRHLAAAERALDRRCRRRASARASALPSAARADDRQRGRR